MLVLRFFVICKGSGWLALAARLPCIAHKDTIQGVK